MGLRTLRKEIIEAEVETLNELDPPELTFRSASEEGAFLFVLTLAGFNLSSVPRMFDITLEQEVYTTGHVLSSRTYLPLVPCSI